MFQNGTWADRKMTFVKKIVLCYWKENIHPWKNVETKKQRTYSNRHLILDFEENRKRII